MTTVATTSVPPTVNTPQQPFLVPAVATVSVLVVVVVVGVVIIIAVVYILKYKGAALKGMQ